MTALITLECDRAHDAHSMCARRTSFKAADVATARAAAGQLGWLSHTGGKDYCPGCSGTGPHGSGTSKARGRR